MPYAIGTPTDQHDLLDKLRIFLAANGWTVNMWADDVTSYFTRSGSAGTVGKRLHVSRGSLYLNFRSCVRHTVFGKYNTSTTAYTSDGVSVYGSQHTGIAFYMSTGYDGGLAWDMQPGGPRWPTETTKSMGAGHRMSGAIPSYRFFLTNDPFMLVISLEETTAVWRHLILCDVQKYGTWTGGEMFAGSVCMGRPIYSAINYDLIPLQGYQDADSYDRGLRISGGGQSSQGWALGSNDTQDGSLISKVLANVATEAAFTNIYQDFTMPLLACLPSNFTGILPLLPMHVAQKVAGYAETRLLGEIPGLRLTRMDGHVPGDIITMGASKWMILPVTYVQSGYFCPAYAIPYDGA